MYILPFLRAIVQGHEIKSMKRGSKSKYSAATVAIFANLERHLETPMFFVSIGIIESATETDQ